MKAIRLIHTTVFRLAMLYAGLFSLLTVVCLSAIYWITTSQISAQIDAGLRAESSALERLYQIKGIGALRSSIMARSTTHNLAVSESNDAGPRQYLLTDARLRPLAGTLSAWPAGVNPKPQLWVTLTGTLRKAEPGAGTLDRDDRVRAIAVVLRGGYHLLVGQSLNEIHDWRNGFLALTIGAIGLILTAAIVGGVLVGRGVLRRLEAVTRAADTIMTGDLSQRIPEDRPSDEFGALAQKLNEMLSRIEQLMQSTREVTENVAHDLRSPLGRLRTRAEMALLDEHRGPADQETLQDIIEETDRITAILNAILSIAQIESGARREYAAVDLSAVCHDAAELYEAAADDKGLVFRADIVPGLMVHGNRQLLAQAVGNLLDNAIKYTPSGGLVSLSLAQRDGRVVAVVSDNGPGIPPELRRKVLERFVRLDASRGTPGNGLGLPLVKAIAAQHGATLVLSDNHPGLRISLSFARSVS